MNRWIFLVCVCVAAGCAEGVEQNEDNSSGSSDAVISTDATGDSREPDSGLDVKSGEDIIGSLCEQKGCDDNNPCTYSTCVGEVCLHSPLEGVGCDDGEICTSGDTCDAKGECVSGELETCDDVSECTEEYCEPGIGCISAHLPNGFPCDDGNSCSVWDECKLGVCAPGAELTCDDSNNCTVLQGCDPETGKCLFLTAPDGAVCDDGNPCSGEDACIGGNCLAGFLEDCDDDNQCTADFCNPKNGVCSNVPAYGDCDDGLGCTEDDSCVEGDCQGASLSCDDGNPCTADTCDEDLGCVYANLLSICDDGNPCTSGDVCSDGVCESGSPVICKEDGPCVVGACEPETGACLTVKSGVGSPCDDGNDCTFDDICNEQAACQGTLVDCDDDNECTEDSCSISGGCTYETLTGAACLEPGTCGKSMCEDGVCKTETDKPCDDQNLCTTDFCSENLGCLFLTNPAENCDDGIDCTFDTCSPTLGCLHTPSGSACDDGSPCTLFECDSLTGCSAQIQFSCCGNGVIENDEVCDDGNVVAGDGCTPLCKGEIGSQFSSCNELKWAYPLVNSGLYTLDVDGDEGPETPQKTFCEMEKDAGGWTLLAVIADDGANTWTPSNAGLWLSGEPEGAVTNLFADYAHSARQKFLVEDLLFVHEPSGDWAAYRGVGEGVNSLGDFVSEASGNGCENIDSSDGIEMTSGTIQTNAGLCDTNLYVFSPGENENICFSGDWPGVFAWSSVADEDQCDDESGPSWAGVGGNSANPDEESLTMGFGEPLALNTGDAGSGENSIRIFVRSGVCGDGIVSGLEACDDANKSSGDGCSEVCKLE